MTDLTLGGVTFSGRVGEGIAVQMIPHYLVFRQFIESLQRK